MDPGLLIFRAIIPAAGISAAILLAGWLIRTLRHRPGADAAGQIAAGHSAAALAIALGYAVGHIAVAGWPRRPMEPHQWLPGVAAAGAILAVLDTVIRRPRWLAVNIDAAFHAGSISLILQPYPMNTWTGAETAVWITALTLATMVLQVGLSQLAGRVRGPTPALLMLVTTTAASIVLLSTGSATMGQLGGVLTSAIGPVVIIAALRPNLALSRGGVRAWSMLLSGLLIIARFNDNLNLPAACFGLVAFAPLAAWIAQAAAIRRRRPWQVLVARLVLVLIPAGLGAVLGGRIYLAQLQEQSIDYESAY